MQFWKHQARYRKKLCFAAALTVLFFACFLSAPEADASAASEDTFLYGAFGNSMTVYPGCSFWVYHCGMAASVPSKDSGRHVKSVLRPWGKGGEDCMHPAAVRKGQAAENILRL